MMKAAAMLIHPAETQGERFPSRWTKAPTASRRVWRPSISSAIMIGRPTTATQTR
jgi:hypothetical protein